MPWAKAYMASDMIRVPASACERLEIGRRAELDLVVWTMTDSCQLTFA
jgi:hypothetical protein